MDYNTTRPDMRIPEYGRNIQKMVDYAVSVEDREERNKVAKAIIAIMGQLNPHLRDVEDFTHKLWTHLFIMSDFKLEVDSPYPIPSPETLQSKPAPLTYPQGRIKYGHYGKTLERLIKKASEYPDGDEKNALTVIIANLMKKSYLTWNRDTVNDHMIVDQLKELSNGELVLDDIEKLIPTNEIVKGKPPKRTSYKKRRHKGKGRRRKPGK